ncbi:MAG TPA: hypothetical protein VJ180_12360, partial [Pyrinomonadaceae bacterium]|nr:hypothetical protein [Pyrinomonadaceae bacterium]
LATSIVSGTVTANQTITDDRCNMPREKALELALRGISPEVLKIGVRTNSKYVPAFRDEKAIESWFAKVKNYFAQERGIEPVGAKLTYKLTKLPA